MKNTGFRGTQSLLDFFFLRLLYVYLQCTDKILEAFSIVNHFIAAVSRADNTRNYEI